jgi:RND superfamily putative drug exporter
MSETLTAPAAGAPATRPDSRLVRAFVAIAVVEAFTWAGLLVGMYLKHVADVTELGVRIFGSLHGAAFLAYGVLALLTARRQRWPLVWTTVLARASAVPPFATVAFERLARRRGLLDAPA